jgi:hypothetical protein
MRSNKKWSELTPAGKAAVLALAAIEAVLTTLALRDLAARPADEVLGPKWLWRIACLVQPFGPVAYLLVGRRPDTGVVAVRG